jgi:hypothetical protein
VSSILRGHSAVSSPAAYAALKAAAAHTNTATMETAAVKSAMDEPIMETAKAIVEENLVPEEDVIPEENGMSKKERVTKTIPKEEMIVDKKDRAAGEEGEAAEDPGIRPNHWWRRVVRIRGDVWIDIGRWRRRRRLRQRLRLEWLRLQRLRWPRLGGLRRLHRINLRRQTGRLQRDLEAPVWLLAGLPNRLLLPTSSDGDWSREGLTRSLRRCRPCLGRE